LGNTWVVFKLGVILDFILAKINENRWLIQILFFLGFGFLLNWLASSFYSRLQPKLTLTTRIWDESLLNALYKPSQVLIWLMVFSYVVAVVASKLTVEQYLNFYIVLFRELFVLFILFWFVMRFITNLENASYAATAKKPTSRDKTNVRAVSQLVRAVVIVVVILTVMQTLGISISTLLAVGGIGGIAIGFAAKDTLANFLGGMMIFLDRPFSVGDWVRSPDREIEGTVEHIGWRLTIIRTFDKRPLYVPNGVFSTISLENPSRMFNRRIKTVIGLRYQDALKISAILRDIETMLRQHPEIDTNQTLMVNLFEFGSSSLNFFIYTFTKTINWVDFQAIQQDVFLKAIDIIAQHGAACAFPTTTLNFADEQLVNLQGIKDE